MKPRLSNRTVDELQRVLGRNEKKEKTSVSLSGEIIRAADIVAGKARRSALIEAAVRAYLRRLVRRAREERDLAAINSKADASNRESDRLIDLQAWPE